MTESAVSAVCPCDSHQDPQVVSNPPGRSPITDRVDDFTGFRRALLHPLPGEKALGGWRPAPGDFGLQFLEWWAYLADVLTFYNERIANETYLRTAQFPESVAGLVALLGYVPAPGLAAKGQVGAIRSTAYPAELLVIPKGMQLSSTATPGVPPQTFEAEAASFPEPSDIGVILAPDPNLHVFTDDIGPASVLLAGKVTGAMAGDRLLLVEKSWAATDDNWSAVTVAAVSPETDPGTGTVNTRVSFTATTRWGATGAPSATSPRQATDYRLIRPVAAASLWSMGLDDPDADPKPPVVSGDGSRLTVPLSATLRSIHPGDLVFFDAGGSSSALGLVTATTDRLGQVHFPEQPTTPDLVVPYTELTVATPDPNVVEGYSPDKVTAIAIRYGFREVGTVLANPVMTLERLPAAVVAPAGFTLPDGVSGALLEDATGTGAVVQVSLVEAPNGAVSLTLNPAPEGPTTFDPPLAPPLRLIFAIVQVSRGITVTGEVLGSGNAGVANQRFPLAKSPLTYFASGAGWKAALSVSVDGIEWTEVPTLYGQQPGAQVYVVERSPDQRATIRFGDGMTGSRLPSGSGNVVANYRYGSGAACPPSGRLTTVVQRQPNLAAIHNPVAVSGGADPPLPAHVKTDAPASVFTFGRAISAPDYQAIAAQAPGVTRARAYWTFDPATQRNLVKIYVNDDAGGVLAARQALAGSDDPNRPVTVAAAEPIDVFVSATLVVAGDHVVDDVLTAATAHFTDPASGAFSPTQMLIGQWLYRSHVAAALSVPGVVAVHQLEVTWTKTPPPSAEPTFPGSLDEVADPGEGFYFELPAANLTLTGVPANG